MFNEFSKQVNQGVREKGFWDSMDHAISNLEDTAIEYIGTSECAIVKATKDAFIAQKLALIMSEVGEALEAMRKNRYGIGQKDTFEDELADAVIRIADLCGEMNIDLDAQIAWKMAYNSQREAKHGKEF